MERERHIVKEVEFGSIAMEMGIEKGDVLIEINGKKIEDIFDYQYIVQDSYLEVLIEKSSNEEGEAEEWLLEIDKEEWEDLGIVFESGLMDDYKSCHNKCIFCFIDQMPEGMRETLYFKDDDLRLSFLQGNYVTLTNMSHKDIDKIIQYRMEPMNISFQTMNPELRCKMLNNRFAGDALKKADRLYEAGISMNGQIVLCKGINDGAELEYSLKKLFRYVPVLGSVSVVPVGLSRYREGLYPLQPFSKEDAVNVLDTIHKWQKIAYDKYKVHFVHASDEWYVLAEAPLPEAANYDDYMQLENGVGMLRLLLDEFEDSLEHYRKTEGKFINEDICQQISMATGKLAYPYITEIANQLMNIFPNVDIKVYEVVNHFFGERITVSGLLTGQDILEQLKGKELGNTLFLPQNILRSGEDVFLDDMTVFELSKALQVEIDIVKSSGHDFLKVILDK